MNALDFFSKEALLDTTAPISPTAQWIPGYTPGPCTDGQPASWQAMGYLRRCPEVDNVLTPQSWWTRHLEDLMADNDHCNDVHGLPRRKVPPYLRAAFVEGGIKGEIEGSNVNEQGRAKSRSAIVRRSCRVAPSPGATPAPSAVSEAKHSKPLRETIDACRASLRKASLRKKAWQIKQHAAAVAYQDDSPLVWERVDGFRMKVAAYWALREDARRDEEVARAAAARSKAHAAAMAGGGEGGGSGGSAGAVETSEAAEVLNEYKCPITAEIMTDPVCTADGFTYERTAITEWLLTNDTSPSTGAKLACKRLVPNVTVRCLLQRL